MKKHFDRVVELTGGQLASPFVTMAETMSVQKQDRAGFESLLKKAIEIDVNAKPQWRLQNMIMQQRANWLLSRKGDLFVE